jgi:hypothetical protein
MIRHCVIFALFCVGSFAGPTIHVSNKCPFEIWPGIQGNPLVANGGFHLGPGETRDIQVPDGWKAARIWARRNCDANMNCESGFCGVICFDHKNKRGYQTVSSIGNVGDIPRPKLTNAKKIIRAPKN